MEGNKNNKHRLWMSLELRILKLNLDNLGFSNSTMFGWLRVWHLHNGRGVLIFWQREEIQTQGTLKCVSSKKQAKLHKSNKNYTKPSFLSPQSWCYLNHLMHENSWNPTPWGWYVTSAKKIATIWCTHVKCIKTQPAGPNIFIISGH